MVTIFQNILNTDTPFFREINIILDRIKDGASKDLVLKIRKEQNKTLRNELKKQLPSILFSGKFPRRSDVAIESHSGLICLDFDSYNKQKDMVSDKAKFSKDKYCYSVFISPSGKGLKMLVKTPKDIEGHIGYFLALEKYFQSPHFDKTSKNISRVCYESYDPLIYINESSEEWTSKEDVEYKEITNKDSKTIPIASENKIIDILTKWWTKKYPMSEGQRNAHCYILAQAFNEYGLPKDTTTIVLSQYRSKGFATREIEATVKSAYSKSNNFNTKYFEDEQKVNEIQQRLRRGESKKIIKESLEEEGYELDQIEGSLEKADEENTVKFWIKSSKGIIKAVPIVFKTFLENHGFYKYCPEVQKNYVFVRIQNGLIDHCSEKDIKDFILSHLITQEDSSIYNYFADQTRLFKEDFLTLLDTKEITFLEDTIDTSYLYYENCAVKITKDKVEKIDYMVIAEGGTVWRDHVINRPFRECETSACDYKMFVDNICDKDLDRIRTMESTIGFMLHGHKNVSYCPAVILNDEVISDTANGGTGKGLWLQALGHMKKLVMIDGKAFAFEKSFPYQLVSADTQLLCFDDVKKFFDFERLFSVVTEGLTLEKKNKDAIKIPFSRSPKIAITTNYAIKGSGNSFIRRKWELELSQHYNKSHTPLDDFGKFLFGDWDVDEWCQFDNYMMKNIQLYLKFGLIKSQFVNLKIRQLSAETCHDFIEWCGLLDGKTNQSLKVDEKLYMQPLYMDFIIDYPDYGPRTKMTISRTKFYKWLVSYCLFKEGLEPIIDRDTPGKWMRIRPREEGQVQQEIVF